MYEGVKRTVSPFRPKELAFKTPVAIPDQVVKQTDEQPVEETKQTIPQEGTAEDAEDDNEEEAAEADEAEKTIIKKMYGYDAMTNYVQSVRDQHLPIEERSVYTYFAPDSEKYEMQLEKRFHDYNNRKVMAKREKQEIVTMMDEWAHAKGRISDESSRRNESMKHGSRFPTRAFIPRPQTAFGMDLRAGSVERPRTGLTDKRAVPSFGVKSKEKYVPEDHVDLDDDHDQSSVTEDVRGSKTEHVTIYKEKSRPVTANNSVILDYTRSPALNFVTGQQIDRQPQPTIEEQKERAHIQNIRNFYGGLINAKETFTPNKAEGKKMLPSLSVHESRERTKQRSFSEVLNSKTPEARRDSQFEESEEIKKKLARFKINVPITTVLKSVLVPDSVSKAELTPIPNMGSRLLDNPFAKKKKKKGGKKKRR